MGIDMIQQHLVSDSPMVYPVKPRLRRDQAPPVQGHQIFRTKKPNIEKMINVNREIERDFTFKVRGQTNKINCSCGLYFPSSSQVKRAVSYYITPPCSAPIRDQSLGQQGKETNLDQHTLVDRLFSISTAQPNTHQLKFYLMSKVMAFPLVIFLRFHCFMIS